MENNINIARRRGAILLLGFISFALVIVAISVVVTYLNSDKTNVDIINQNTVSNSADTSITKHDYSLIKQQLRDVLASNYNLQPSEEINATIRESTYEEYGEENNKTISFVLDVENVKVTYNIWMTQSAKESIQVSISCASAKDSKYPETFCIGSEGYSSIDSTLASDLPYRRYNGDSQVFKIEHEPYDPKLTVSIFAECDDKTAENNAMNEIKKWISSYGLDAEQIPIEKDSTACLAYEDELARSNLRKHGE